MRPLERYMRSKLRLWFLDRIGHRGFFLAILGLYDAFFGIYLLAGGNLQYRLELTHIEWGWAWVGFGIFISLGALFRKDAPFYSAAVFIKTVWTLELVRVAVVVNPVYWWRSAYWLCFALLVLVASAWPEPRIQVLRSEAVSRAQSVKGGEV
jgi:hypothetical protein